MVKHPVILRGYHAAPNDRAALPVLVKRLDEEFIPAVLDGVRRKATPQALGKIPDTDVDGETHALRLFQPVHRTFNLILLEAVCDQPGFPRLNPRDIASAGFVIRRLENGESQGWLLQNQSVLGWSNPADQKLDPDPLHRRPLLNAGHPHVNNRLARVFEALEPAAERVSPLFVAPPDVCAEAGRTVLYGMVPVTSAERSDGDAPPATLDPADVDKIMPGFLKGTGIFQAPNPGVLSDPSNAFVQELRLIQFGWRVFDSTPGAIILGLLNGITVGFLGAPSRPLGEYLQGLCQFVILGDGPSVALPNFWPRPDAVLASRIQHAAQKSMEAAISAILPNEQRFDRPKAQYRVHPFMRVRSADDCPPHLHWSEPSAPFQIVPWWESGDGRLHTITLPEFDIANVGKFKPNIAFAVPPSLAGLLRDKSPTDFLEGKPGGGGPSIGWICSFSIPIITLCAFIVLNIFLQLLHVVFQWLFYIKICLPYPKKR
jgi:hypothetical protein